jgi:DNA modification methylase
MELNQIELNQIVNAKWEDGMPTVPSNSVDLIVTSPPYNVNLGNNKHKKDAYASYDDNMPYDEYLRWMTCLFYACNRVLKIGGRLCINIGDGANGSVPTHADFINILVNDIGQVRDMDGRLTYYSDVDKIWYTTEVNPDNIQPFKMMTTIVWNKQQIGASTAWGSFQSPSCPSFPTPFEFIIVVAKGQTKHEGDKSKISISKEDFIANSRALWTFPPETQMMKKYNHPAMFPEELPRRLIDHLTYEDDVVLDPFSGAGTTCAVAKKMKRKYIGFEMSEQYYNESLQRLGEISNTVEMIMDGKKVDVPEWLIPEKK